MYMSELIVKERKKRNLTFNKNVANSICNYTYIIIKNNKVRLMTLIKNENAHSKGLYYVNTASYILNCSEKY
jgi:hypothetical protein